MKKTYNRPELTIYGSVTEMTQISVHDVKKVADFVTKVAKNGNIFAELS